MADTRKDRRAPVSLKVRFKSATVDEFIEHYCKDVSRGGIFIKSSQPMAIGTLLKFQFQLKDESSLIKGVGRVVWVRSPEDAVADQPAGMGIKFIKMDNESRAMVDRIVEGQDFDGGAFDQGRATASAQETPSERPHATTDNFFPEIEPAELPPPEDRTAVRQAAQFLAAALAEGGTDKAAASEAEQKAEEARQRTAQIEAQRLAQAAPTTTGGSGSSLPSMIIDPTLGPSEGKPLSAPPKPESAGPLTEPPLKLGHSAERAPLTTLPPPSDTQRPSPGVSVTPLPPAKKSPLLPAAILVGIVAVAAWVALKEKPREVEAPMMVPSADTAPAEPTPPPAPTNAPAVGEPAPVIAEPELPDAALPPAPEAPAEQLKNVEIEVKSTLPPEAELSVAGEARGKAPLKLQLPEGVATIIVARAPGYGESSQEVTPSAGQQKPLRFTLSPLPYVVRVNTTPPGAKISVGAKRGTAPADIVLGTAFKGMLGVAARLPGHETARATLRAEDFTQSADNMLSTVSLVLTPLPPAPPAPVAPKLVRPRVPAASAPVGSPHPAIHPAVDAGPARAGAPASGKAAEPDAASAPEKPSERPVERPVELQKPAEPAPAPAGAEPAKTTPPAKPAGEPTKPEKLPPNPFG